MFICVACASDEEKKTAHLEKGKEYFEKGEYKSAEIEFKNAVQVDPQAAKPRFLKTVRGVGYLFVKEAPV